MARFVLVHGAAHGGWCWEKLATLLAARGHVVDAPDLPGAGADPTPAAEVTLEHCVTRVYSRVTAGAGPVVLVGHSMGGVTVTGVAEICPERIICAVHVTAFMLRDGERVRDITLLEHSPSVLDAIEFEPGGEVYRYRPEAARALFYGDCTAAAAAQALARLRPVPRVIAQTPIHWSAARAGRVPRVYVQCRADRAIPLALQQHMCARLPPARVLEIDCGHSPFLAAPGELAAHLHDVAEGFAAPSG